MRLWANTLLKIVAGAYFLVTSLYCLLAFLPYTFCAFIKTPPYAWMPWFAHHQAALYWVAIAAGLGATWQGRVARSKAALTGAALLAVGGAYVTVRPFLLSLESNNAAYIWSLTALLPLIGFSLWELSAAGKSTSPESTQGFGFGGGLAAATAVSLVYGLGARLRLYSDTHTLGLHWQDVEIGFWSLISHAAIAVAALSAVNLVFLLAGRGSRARALRRLLTGALIVACLWFALSRFLGNAMSFEGVAAYLYAGTFSLTLTLWGFWLCEPFLVDRPAPERRTFPRTAVICIVMLCFALLALGSRWLIGGEDWNGFVESTGALLCWIAMTVCIYRMWPTRRHYSATAIVGTLVVCIFVYKGLQISEIFWARPLGATDDEISIKLEDYGARDASFLLAHHILGNSRGEACGDLCHIMRQYTNVRDGRTTAEVTLVDNLTPTRTELPNIFIFVVDAMRPDYLGAYNPRATYTPNLDALARDSIVFHNAYSQYAGTSLSEPALWAGAMMLHAHYLKPFSQVNGLEKLLRADRYHMVVSMDEVAKEILSPSDDMVKLDTDKELWNQLEIGSTLRQAQSVLSADTRMPIFFYDQPKNVHQFARNDVPSPTSQHWQSPAGMNSRITYEVHWVDSRLGEFFNFLKQRGMYDNSIIIVTSDHGDATGEFGRNSHSISIWPEIMKVPLIVHLPARMRQQLVYDDSRLSTLTDITPTLYYLLGHRPIRKSPVYGRPLFAETRQELDSYRPDDVLLASDVRAVYGILTADGKYLYTTYDSPAVSYLFDLAADPNAEHSILTPALKQRYDEEIIERLHVVGDFYGYKPGVGSLLAARR